MVRCLVKHRDNFIFTLPYVPHVFTYLFVYFWSESWEKFMLHVHWIVVHVHHFGFVSFIFHTCSTVWLVSCLWQSILSQSNYRKQNIWMENNKYSDYTCFCVFPLIRINLFFPCGGREFFSSPPRPERLWGPPSLLSNGYQGFFLWV
jgi:hypothetical protein